MSLLTGEELSFAINVDFTLFEHTQTYSGTARLITCSFATSPDQQTFFDLSARLQLTYDEFDGQTV
jgi:hypothetical protein